MKIAISGKGGVGKSTIAAILSLELAARGERVLALDADPDANLASALGMPDELQRSIKTIQNQVELIEERTGAKVGVFGQMFDLDPKVDDVADKYATHYRGVDLLVLGAETVGGSGCACPENAFIKALVDNLVMERNQTLVMDMEAGVEHLGRATAQSVDLMLVVVEPGKRSLDCARHIRKMAADIGLRNLKYVGSKVDGPQGVEFLAREFEEDLICCLPYSDAVRRADRDGVSPYDAMDDAFKQQVELLMDAICSK